MNSDTIKGELKQVSGKIKEKIGDLTNDKARQAEGAKDVLAGKAQVAYGKRREKVEHAAEEVGKQAEKVVKDVKRSVS